MKRAVIFCGGEMDTDSVWLPEYKESLVLCADGGYKHALRIGVAPDMIIGDMDSGIKKYPPSISHKVYPSEKDLTDTNICLDYAIEKGCSEVILLGGLGGRLDHEFSHYCLLLYGLRKGVKVKIVNGKNEIWMEKKPFSLYPTEKKYISFFPYGGVVEKFSVRGLKYNVENITLDFGQAQASSNQFDGEERADITFKNGGLILVMRCQDKDTEM